MAVFGQYARGLALTQHEVLLLVDGAAHPQAVGQLVGLCAQRVNRRAFAGIEHTRLEERVVDRQSHLAAQRIQLTHQMPLGCAADGGIARHERHRVQIERQKQRLKAQTRAGQARLASSVTRADDDNVKTFQ